ncbi:hypothetical protein [Bacillus manliponensis]|nr:hypothetical protein [Bacillus manliponensis]
MYRISFENGQFYLNVANTPIQVPIPAQVTAILLSIFPFCSQ